MRYTAEQLRALDGDFENWHYALEDGDEYQLTKGEIEWLWFVKGRYSIEEAIMDNITIEGDDDEQYWLKVDTYALSKALADDGCNYKAACLDEETVLASILFYSCYELDEDENQPENFYHDLSM
jgi:hypothetical protein